MVTTVKSSSNDHSPPITSVPSTGDINSPKLPRNNLPSPWAQVVRGGEPESTGKIHQSPPSSLSSSSSLAAAGTADQVPSSDSSPKAVPATPPVESSNTVAAAVLDSSDVSDDNAGRSKKPAWNKPSNGVVEAGPVMGAESWPALSATTKASVKSPAELSSKTVADGSLSSSQVSVTSYTPQNQASNNAKPHSAPNYSSSNRQRSMKRAGQGGSSIGSIPALSSFPNPPRPPPPPPFPLYQFPPVSYSHMVPVITDPSGIEDYRYNNWDTRPVGGFVPAMNEARGSSRRGTFGSHPRGDGSYHRGRDQDRVNYGNTRDAHVPQPRAPPRGLLRHPPPSTPAFVASQPFGAFPNPMAISEFYYLPSVTMEHYRGVPFFNHSPSPPATFYHAAAEPPNSNISDRIVKQIDYYFSDDNLERDEYLKSNMDEHGWVPISLIANFPRVRTLTSNTQLILDSMRTSAVVEVQGDKLRKKFNWMQYLSSGAISSSGSKSNNLATDFQAVTLNETTKGEGAVGPSSQSQLPNGGNARGNNY